MPFLKPADFGGMFQRHANIIQSADVTILVERIDIKADCVPVRQDDLLCGKIDQKAVARIFQDRAEQVVNDVFIQHDGQQAVLPGIVKKDIGETGCNYNTETMVHQRPHGMLTRRPTAEIMAAQQDRGALVMWMIEHKIRVLFAAAVVHAGFAVVKVAPFIKQVVSKAAAFDRLQELFRNNGVGIDIVSVQRHDDAMMLVNLYHACDPLESVLFPANIREMPGHGCGRGHCRTHQVRAPALPLAPFKVPVGR
jgi:hypothetical protein